MNKSDWQNKKEKTFLEKLYDTHIFVVNMKLISLV